MTEKDRILARIREALTVSAPASGTHGEEGSRVSTAPAISSARDPRPWLPAVGESFDSRLELFQENSADLKSTFHLVHDRAALAEALRELRDAEAWKKIATHSGELTNEAARILELPVCRTDQPYDVHD